MTLGNVFGCIGLIFAGILLFCMVVLWLQKRFPNKEFDERQQVSRGKACELGLLVGVVYFLAIMPAMIGQVDGEKKIEPYLLVFFGVMLETMVMSTYGLLTHSYLSFQQKPIFSMFGFLACGIMNLLSFATNWERFGGLTLTGHGTLAWAALIAGCCFLYLALVILIQQLFKEKE